MKLFILKADNSKEMNNIYDKKGTEKATKMLKEKLSKAITKYEDKEAEKVFSQPF